MQRFSQKRESILEILEKSTEHPSAEMIYEKMRVLYPDISLATVYRNLNMLKEQGVIHSVGIINGEERYDYKTFLHAHALCRKCGKVIDVMDVKLPEGLSDRVEDEADFDISAVELQFVGLCKECRENQQK